VGPDWLPSRLGVRGPLAARPQRRRAATKPKVQTQATRAADWTTMAEVSRDEAQGADSGDEGGGLDHGGGSREREFLCSGVRAW
jgi:hypothetical protein